MSEIPLPPAGPCYSPICLILLSSLPLLGICGDFIRLGGLLIDPPLGFMTQAHLPQRLPLEGREARQLILSTVSQNFLAVRICGAYDAQIVLDLQ